MVLGKLSGRSGLKSRLQDLGYVLDQEELNKIFASFKNLADKKREVTDRDLEALMVEEKRIAIEEVHFKLVDLTFNGGIDSTSVANITLESKTQERTTETAEGTGPVDAVCKAIRQAVGIEVKLVDYKVEYGRYDGKLILGDEFTPDGCRIWDKETGESLDKDRFRKDLGNIIQAYQEVAERLGIKII